MTVRQAHRERDNVVRLPRRARYLPVRFVLSYTPGMACPGCSGGHWDICRHTAECPRCGFALDLPAPGGRA